MAKLVLLRLNDHLAGSPQGVPFEDLSIEHLLPRKPGHQQSVARNAFPILQSATVTPSRSAISCSSPRRRTTRPGNLDFARKKDVLFKAAGAPTLPVNAYVRQQGEWKASQIREREAELLRHLDQIWNFGPAPSRPEPTSGAGTPSKRARQPQTAGA